MFLWRISNYADLSGAGAEISSGRWHTASAGKRILYLTEHPAVSLIENLANLGAPPAFIPEKFQLLRIVAPDSILADELSDTQITKINPLKFAFTQKIGDAWLKAGSSCLLRVPSVPSPESWNYLLNPLHVDAAQIRIEWAKALSYDRRLFHLSK